MKEIVAPYKGKYVVVNFWGTGCVPCRAHIEREKPLRDKYRDDPRFTFLFVTGDGSSDRSAYDAYVAKNLSNDNCVYLTEDEEGMMYELFRFNSIPYFVLIDPEGNVAKENFNGRMLPLQLVDYGITLDEAEEILSKTVRPSDKK